MTTVRCANRRGRLKAVHDWHLQIHEYDVEWLAIDGRQDLSAVGGDHDTVASFLQDERRHPLIERVIFDEQDMETSPVADFGDGRGEKVSSFVTGSREVPSSRACISSAGLIGLVMQAMIPSDRIWSWEYRGPVDVRIRMMSHRVGLQACSVAAKGSIQVGNQRFCHDQPERRALSPGSIQSGHSRPTSADSLGSRAAILPATPMRNCRCVALASTTSTRNLPRASSAGVVAITFGSALLAGGCT